MEKKRASCERTVCIERSLLPPATTKSYSNTHLPACAGERLSARLRCWRHSQSHGSRARGAANHRLPSERPRVKFESRRIRYAARHRAIPFVVAEIVKGADSFDWSDALWLGCCTPMLGLAIVYANRVGTTPDAIGAPFAGVIESGIDMGGVVYSMVSSQPGGVISAIRFLVAAALAAWLLVGMRSAPRAGWPARSVLLGSLVLAWIGQWYLMNDQIPGGVALYCVAALAYLRRPPISTTEQSARTRGFGFVLMFAFFAFFLISGSYELDVHPGHDLDETAYLTAAEMRAGLREPRDVVARAFTVPLYTFAQFRAQAIPLWSQAVGVLALEPGLLALRLTSLISMGLALMCAAIPIRKRLGVFAAAGMIGLWSASPLVLTHSRMGFYIAASVLHGTLCFAAVLWLYDRWNTRSAVWLGGLLGASLYNYQLSWFVPVMAALACIATPELWRRSRRVQLLLVVAGSALFVALPGIATMSEGFSQVLSQTVSKRIRVLSEGSGGTVAYFVAPVDAAPEAISQFSEQLEGDGLLVEHSRQPSRTVFQVSGSPPTLKGAIEQAERSDWIALSQSAVFGGPWTRLSATLSMLFFKPDWQLMGRFVDAPILNPFLAPLMVLGLCDAFLRRRQFVFRLLLVWVIAGALVPAIVGAPYPRRTVLMLPFAFSLAALPIAEAFRSLATRRATSMAAVALLAAFSFAVAATGNYLYFRRWDQPVVAESVPGLLRFAKAIKSLPPTERVLTPRTYGRGWSNYVTRYEVGVPGGVTQIAASTRDDIREISCALTPPFRWAVPGHPQVPDRYAVLSDDFRVTELAHGTYTLFRIIERKGGACLNVRAPNSPG
jgi:hypothetical protein